MRPVLLLALPLLLGADSGGEASSVQVPENGNVIAIADADESSEPAVNWGPGQHHDRRTCPICLAMRAAQVASAAMPGTTGVYVMGGADGTGTPSPIPPNTCVGDCELVSDAPIICSPVGCEPLPDGSVWWTAMALQRVR